MTGLGALVATENARLVTALEGLDDGGWHAPSLCAGWRVRDVAAHLLMPYELGIPRFLLELAAARFDVDRLASRWAVDDMRSRTEVLAALRASVSQRFGVPGAPPEAPLSHLVIHAEDVYRPLGLDHAPGAESAAIVLDQLTGPRGRAALAPGLVDGLAWTATDTGWTYGSGPAVRATASALITTLAGRTAALDDLSGDGADEVRGRLSTQRR